MLVLSNTTAQTLQPGQAITFDTILQSTGNGECCRNQSGRFPTSSIRMRGRNGIYAVSYGANIGGVAAGAVQLSVQLNDLTLSETTAISQTAAAGNLNNVYRSTRIFNDCECSGNRVSIVNTGTTALTVGANSVFILERKG